MFDAHQILGRLRLNLGAHFFGYLVTILNQVLLLPVFLFFWPKTLYGEWLVLSALPVYISLSDFGMESVGGNRMSMAVAKGDYATANVYLQTYFVFQSVILFAVFVLTVVLACIGEFPKWLSIETVTPMQVNVAMVLLMVRALLACQVGIFRAIYRSNFLAARGTFLNNLCRFADFFTTALVVALGFGIVGLSVTMLIVHVVVVAYMYVDSRRTCPQFHLGWKQFSMKELRSVLPEGVAYQLVPASVMILMQGMTLIVNYMLGPVAVVAYNATRVLYRTSFVGVQMIGWAASPELSILYARADWSKLSRLFRTMMQCLMWFCLFIALVIGFAGSFAVSVLTYGKVHVYGWFLIFFAIGVLTNGFWNSASVLLTATNRHVDFAKRLFLLSLFMIPLSLLLIRLFGLSGAPLATLIVDLLVCPYVWGDCRKILREGDNLPLVSLFQWPDISKIWSLVRARKS